MWRPPPNISESTSYQVVEGIFCCVFTCFLSGCTHLIEHDIETPPSVVDYQPSHTPWNRSLKSLHILEWGKSHKKNVTFFSIFFHRVLKIHLEVLVENKVSLKLRQTLFKFILLYILLLLSPIHLAIVYKPLSMNSCFIIQILYLNTETLIHIYSPPTLLGTLLGL